MFAWGLAFRFQPGGHHSPCPSVLSFRWSAKKPARVRRSLSDLEGDLECLHRLVGSIRNANSERVEGLSFMQKLRRKLCRRRCRIGQKFDKVSDEVSDEV